jgi:hypothetical protein
VLPAWIPPIIGGFVGGVFGFIAALIVFWLTGRRVRKEREQAAGQEVLRIVLKLRVALSKEEALVSKGSPEYLAISHSIEEFTAELSALVVALPKSVRGDFRAMIEVLDERWDLGITDAGYAAISIMRHLVVARLDDKCPPPWVARRVDDLSSAAKQI